MVQELLDEMDRIVRDYHPDVGRTGKRISELIAGTSMFPGGAGLWRSEFSFGALPEFFPDTPVMFVGHNFDSIAAHDASQQRGGEGNSTFWKILRGYLDVAGLRPDQCFFTNALMGLKPGSAVGPMPTVPGYEEQCRAFLLRQIEIVKPCAVIALGNSAEAQIKKSSPNVVWTRLRHPSARDYIPLATRRELVWRMGQALRTKLIAWGVVELLPSQPIAVTHSQSS